MTLLKSDSQTLQKGMPAPTFSLKNVTGEVIPLENFEGKIVVVLFMCNHCPYVVPKLDEIKEIQDSYEDKGVVLICINANNNPDYPEDDFEHMQKLATEKGLKYYLFDETQEVAKAYGATCTPDPFIFDKEHKLAYHGRINDAMSPDSKPTKHDMKEVLDDILEGKEIEDWFRYSMGCSIKWKD